MHQEIQKRKASPRARRNAVARVLILGLAIVIAAAAGAQPTAPQLPATITSATAQGRQLPLTPATMTPEENAAYTAAYNGLTYHYQQYQEAVKWKHTAEAQKASTDYAAARKLCERIVNGEYAEIQLESLIAKAEHDVDTDRKVLAKYGIRPTQTGNHEYQVQRSRWDQISLDNKRTLVAICYELEGLVGQPDGGSVRIVDPMSGSVYARAEKNGDIWINPFVASSKSSAELELDRLSETAPSYSIPSSDSDSTYVPPVAPSSPAVYVPAGSHTFHSRWCKLLKGNWSTVTRDQAVAAGMRACGTCKP